MSTIEGLNDKTIRDAYPIPRIDDNMDALSAAKWSLKFIYLECKYDVKCCR